MTRFLAPYTLPLIGAMAAALLAACGWIYVQSQWLDRAEAERDALQRRVETIQAVKELRNEAADTSNDDLSDSISNVPSGGR